MCSLGSSAHRLFVARCCGGLLGIAVGASIAVGAVNFYIPRAAFAAIVSYFSISAAAYTVCLCWRSPIRLLKRVSIHAFSLAALTIVWTGYPLIIGSGCDRSIRLSMTAATAFVSLLVTVMYFIHLGLPTASFWYHWLRLASAKEAAAAALKQEETLRRWCGGWRCWVVAIIGAAEGSAFFVFTRLALDLAVSTHT